MEKFRKAFRRLPDPRADNASHELLEVLLIAWRRRCAAQRALRTWPRLANPRKGCCGWCCGWSTGSPATTRSAESSACWTRRPSRLHSGGSWRRSPRPTGWSSAACWRSTAGLARGLRAGSTEHAAAHGQYLATQARRRWLSAKPVATRPPARWKCSPCWTSKAVPLLRCAALPSRLCHDGARSGRAILAGTQGKSEQAVHCRRPGFARGGTRSVADVFLLGMLGHIREPCSPAEGWSPRRPHGTTSTIQSGRFRSVLPWERWRRNAFPVRGSLDSRQRRRPMRLLGMMPCSPSTTERDGSASISCGVCAVGRNADRAFTSATWWRCGSFRRWPGAQRRSWPRRWIAGWRAGRSIRTWRRPSRSLCWRCSSSRP